MTAVPIIAVNPAYNLFLNNMTKTVLLNQLIYWDQRKVVKRWNECWIVKTSEQLADEICHGSAKSVGDWLREFKKMGIIRVKRGFFNGINQLWIQVEHDKITALLADFADHLPSNNVPETDVTPDRNLPLTDSPAAVTYPTGNCISKTLDSKKIDFIEDDIFKILSQEQIDTVTKRVTEQVNSRRVTTFPIRNPERYLRVSLENEARKFKAQAPSDYQSSNTNDIEWVDFPEPKPREFPTDAIWDAVVAQMQTQWDENHFSVWMEPTRFESKDDQRYVIAVPNAYIADMLQYRLYDDVKIALCELTQRDFEVIYVVRRMG